MSAELVALARSVFMVGFNGTTAAAAPLEALRAFGPGGVILFGRNAGAAADLGELTGALRALDEPPPLIAVDQEGGRVARFGDPVTPVSPAMALGAAGDVGACEAVARRLGRELAGLGVSVDFAPVADLALDPLNTVIGTRAFGASPHRVADLVIAFARGLERGGVASALKHFPGHGSTSTDSHVALPRVTTPAATLRERDLVPFASAIAAGAPSIVMLAHAVFDAFDATQPATFSARIAGELLRGELGFGGVVVTDCLEMDAIAAEFGTVAGAVRALGAGADLLLVSHTLATAAAGADAIVAAIAAGTLPEARLREAAARVRALRERLAHVPRALAVTAVPARAIAARAVTVLRGDVRLQAQTPVTVISFEGAAFDGAGGARSALPSLSAALRALRWKSEVMRVALDPGPDDVDVLLSHLPALGARNFVIVVRRAHLHPAQRVAVERILATIPDAILISANEPFDALLWPTAQRVACTYGDDELSFAGCADVLAGASEPQGRLPVAADALR